MNIMPIPNELLGDDFVLLIPKKSGGTDRTEIRNVRVERTDAVADNSASARVCTELSIWFDCDNSLPADAEFRAGERAEYRGEIYELTEVRTLGADKPHHIKIKARIVGGEYSD